MNNQDQKNIVIYRPRGKAPKVKVKLEAETLWLSLNQLASLFQRDKSVMSRHIRNIVKTGELQRNSVVAKFATTAADGKTYQVDYYNLDMIISVGYRVNSVVGTHFRIWATNVLREYTVKGYALNEKRLREAQEHLDELSRSIRLIQTVAETRKLSQDETRGLLQVISDYAYGLKTLDEFDRRSLTIRETQEEIRFILDYEVARRCIDEMSIELKKSGEEVGHLSTRLEDMSMRSTRYRKLKHVPI